MTCANRTPLTWKYALNEYFHKKLDGQNHSKLYFYLIGMEEEKKLLMKLHFHQSQEIHTAR